MTKKMLQQLLRKHLEEFIYPRPPDLEYEIRIGSNVAGSYKAGVDSDVFDRITERIDAAANLDKNIMAGEWNQFVDRYWSMETGMRYRTRTYFDTNMCTMSSTTICKKTLFTASAPCNNDIACLVCKSRETPIDVTRISTHTTLNTSLSIRKRFTFEFPTNNATLFLDCTLRWFGDTIGACEKLYEEGSPPQRSIELEIDEIGSLKNETIASVVDQVIVW